MKKLNNKGFTLVELLAVVVILVIIMGIALPNISSSIERSNAKKDTAMEKVIKSEGELYISKHRAAILERLSGIASGTCSITVEQLISEGYLTDEDVADYNDSCLIYDGNNLEYSKEGCSGYTSCYGD